MTSRTCLPFFAAVALILTVGCNPTLYAVTSPPPTRTAELTSKKPFFGDRKYYATVSAGVALAFNCSRSGPCKQAVATSDDSTIVRVAPAHLNQLESDIMAVDRTRPATFLLIGVQPGETWVRVRSKSGNTKIKVTVVD